MRRRLRSLIGLFRALPLSRWYHVTFDIDTVEVSAEPPGRRPWTQRFSWDSIERIVLKVEGELMSDGIYVFTSERPESFVIPMDAEGGPEFWNEVLQRGLFDAELAIQAATSVQGTFVWPPQNG